ncbi:MAG: protein tyrosine phosphatase family protein [Isosphaeraceae bacterium]
MDAPNTCQIFDWLWTSGQPSATDIAQMPSLGIETVINLALPTSPGALPDEARLVTSLGLTYIHLPIVWESPQKADFTRFSRLLGALHGQPVWLHCAMNMRVSAFVYLYRRVSLHHDPATAATPMLSIWQPNETWQAFIDTILASS